MIGELVLPARSDRDAAQARLARPAHRRAARRAHWRRPDGQIALQYTSRALGVSRQTVLQRVKARRAPRRTHPQRTQKSLRIELCAKRPVLADISKGAL